MKAIHMKIGSVATEEEEGGSNGNVTELEISSEEPLQPIIPPVEPPAIGEEEGARSSRI